MTWRNKVVTMQMFILLVLAGGASAAQERVTRDSPKWMSPLARRLAVCYSRGSVTHHVFNAEGEFGGIASWAISTWRLDAPPGYPSVPYRATLRQQNSVLSISLRRHRHFGCLSGSEHAWVRG